MSPMFAVGKRPSAIIVQSLLSAWDLGLEEKIDAAVLENSFLYHHCRLLRVYFTELKVSHFFFQNEMNMRCDSLEISL